MQLEGSLTNVLLGPWLICIGGLTNGCLKYLHLPVEGLLQGVAYAARAIRKVDR